MPRLAALLALALLLALAPVAAAAPKQERDARGGVAATFSYTEREGAGYADLRLRIERGGAPVYDHPVRAEGCEEPFCFPGGGIGGRSVRVRDLDGDGEPEVLLDLFTGGAHCCLLTQVAAFDGTGYAVRAQPNWGDPGYRLEDVDGDGRLDFRSADPRFSYAFTAYAFSAFPIQVFSWRDGALVDRTNELRAAVRADARFWMREYRRRTRVQQPQGPLSAWAADQYRLGRRAHALRVVRREVRSGRLRGVRGTAHFARRLDRTLRRWGY